MRKMWKKATALSMIAVMLLSQPVYAGYPYVGNKAEYQEAYKATKEKAAEIAKEKMTLLYDIDLGFMGKKVYNTHSLIMGKLYLPIRVVVLVEQKIKR